MKIWGIKGLGREKWGIIDEITGVKWGFWVRDIFTDYSRLRALRLIFLLSSPVILKFRLCGKVGILACLRGLAAFLRKINKEY